MERKPNTADLQCTVTASMLRAGVRWDCYSCPVALAIREALGPVARNLHIVASLGGIGLGGYVVPTPKPVADFIAAFDAGQPVLPFTFTLEAPTFGASPAPTEAANA